MSTLRVAVFTAPGTAADLSDRVTAALERRADLLRAGVTVRCYQAPDMLVGRHLVMAELTVRGWRPIEAAACGSDAATVTERFAGELVERVALCAYEPPRAAAGVSENELRARGDLDVFDVRSYLGEPLDPAAWPFPRYDPDAPVDWTVADDLVTGRPVYLPVALCTARAGHSPGVPQWCEPTTNGTAAGRGRAVATAHAVRELYERDALRLAWFTGNPLRPVREPGWWREDRAADEAAGWRTEFFAGATRLGVPLWVVLTRHRRSPMYAIGSACDEDAEDGLRHALDEALRGRMYPWLRRGARFQRTQPIRTFRDHVDYYSDPARIGELDTVFPRRMTEAVPAARDASVPRQGPRHGLGPGYGHHHAWPDGDDVPGLPVEGLGGAVRLRLLRRRDLEVVRILHPRLQPVESAHAAARLVGWARTSAARRGGLRAAPAPFA
ncbi:YcaO-like family protein [Actinomadura miaoliensis]|uniref:YcaO domain-containing protein n=1 Tax=Actinomadura miaoliensis TaxID=430685 RepID=A0ABP7VHB3_9ACTN